MLLVTARLSPFGGEVPSINTLEAHAGTVDTGSRIR